MKQNSNSRHKVIPVAFSASNQYAQHLCVVLTSILENNKEPFFAFNVISADMSEKNKRLMQELKESYPNFSLSFLNIDKKKFSHIKVQSRYAPVETYFRFLLAELFPQYDKLLYLDADVIVNGDIEPLFDTDIEDYYFAGVEERCLYGTGYIENTLKIPHDGIYINAGVLLCNLRKIREDNLTDEFFRAQKYLHTFTKYDDQDIINIVAKGKIKQVDCKYNFTPAHLYELPYQKYQAVIIHYTGKYKPWTLGECPNELRFLYFKYLKKSPYAETLKVKNFCVYHKAGCIFETDVVTPIQTGTHATKRGMDMLQTSSGLSLDEKNKNYGELTAWYWVWKNYMPEHPETEYIGFCHYRRFLDYQNKPVEKMFLYPTLPSEFIDSHNDDYSAEAVYEKIKDYDIVLPAKHVLKKQTVEEQYLEVHPKKDLELLKEIVRKDYPEYVPAMHKVLNGKSAYFCLLFTMKTELLNEFFAWAFDILFKLEKKSDWRKYKEYDNMRVPAYLIERFFNVWLEYKKKAENLKILERRAYILDFEHYVPQNAGMIDHDKLMFAIEHLWRYRLKKIIYKIKKTLWWGKNRIKYQHKYKAIKSFIKAAANKKKAFMKF